MLGKTHLLGGVATLLAADIYEKGISTDIPTAFACIMVVLVGALTPDLDKPTSLIYTKIPAGGLIGHIINPLFIGGHRHLSHSILGFVIFAWLSHFLLFTYVHLPGLNVQIIWISYLIGVFSHLLLDSLTTEGIPLLFPLPFMFGIPPIKALRITTGSWVEHLIVVPLLILAIGFMFYHYYPILLH
jgi:inner membrane protein